MGRMMRIGLIAPPWIPVPPPAYGGTEEVIDGLARGLVALKHDVILAAGPGSTCPVSRIESTERGIAAPVSDRRSEREHAQRAYRELGDVDIIHDHTLAGPLFMWGRVPRVSTVHGPFDTEMTEHFGRIQRSVGLIAISQHQASTSGRVRIDAVIHHGIDLDSIPFGDGGGGYFAFLGRMTPEKGVREAIIVARSAGVPLTIAAKMREPLEHDYFESQVRPLLGGPVEYVGELNRADKFRLLGSAAGLINPLQWNEPFGMVMIEAMATGTPVLATTRGSAMEIVEDGVTGFLRSTLDELTSTVVQVPSLNRSAIRARQRDRFSLTRMAADHVDFYESWRERFEPSWDTTQAVGS
jgi:glycosyltransferase involved in cell wall biosynthesis